MMRWCEERKNQVSKKNFKFGNKKKYLLRREMERDGERERERERERDVRPVFSFTLYPFFSLLREDFFV